MGDPYESLLGPLSLGGRVIEGISVHNQVFEIGIVAIQAGVGVRHFVCTKRDGGEKKSGNIEGWKEGFSKKKTQRPSAVPHAQPPHHNGMPGTVRTDRDKRISENRET